MQYVPMREKHSQLGVRDVRRPDMFYGAVPTEWCGPGGQKT